MSLCRRPGASRTLIVLSMTALAVSACATAPTAPKGGSGKADSGYGRMAPIPNPESDKRPSASRPAARSPASPRVASPSKPPPAPTAAVKPPASNGRDPARARTLRAQGLEQLNRGAIDKAQDLLRQALRLDPGNPLIQRDLDRATRIGQAVRAKP